MWGIALKILAFVNKNYKAVYLLYQLSESLYKHLKSNNIMGLWNKKAEKGFSSFIIDKLKFKPIVRPVAGIMVNYGVSWLDDNHAPKIPEILHPAYLRVGDAFAEYDSNKGVALEDLVSTDDLAVIISSLVDIPGMTEDDEEILIAKVLEALLTVVKNHIEKKRKEKNV